MTAHDGNGGSTMTTSTTAGDLVSALITERSTPTDFATTLVTELSPEFSPTVLAEVARAWLVALGTEEPLATRRHLRIALKRSGHVAIVWAR